MVAIRIFLTLGVLFHLAFVAIGWAALWFAMRANQTKHAMGLTVLRVIALPFAVFALFNIICFNTSLKWWWQQQSGYVVVGLLVSLHLANLLHILIVVRRNFYTHFRMLAADRTKFIEKYGWMATLRKRIRSKPVDAPGVNHWVNVK